MRAITYYGCGSAGAHVLRGEEIPEGVPIVAYHRILKLRTASLYGQIGKKLGKQALLRIQYHLARHEGYHTK